MTNRKWLIVVVFSVLAGAGIGAASASAINSGGPADSAHSPTSSSAASKTRVTVRTPWPNATTITRTTPTTTPLRTPVLVTTVQSSSPPATRKVDPLISYPEFDGITDFMINVLEPCKFKPDLTDLYDIGCRSAISVVVMNLERVAAGAVKLGWTRVEGAAFDLDIDLAEARSTCKFSQSPPTWSESLDCQVLVTAGFTMKILRLKEAVAADQKDRPAPLVTPAVLGRTCSDHHATAISPDGTTVYCSQVYQTDWFVWAERPGVVPRPK